MKTYFLLFVLCLSVVLQHVQAVKPAKVIKDSCGTDIVKPTDCFAMKELNTNKWLTTGTSSSKKWLALSDSKASLFAFKNDQEDTNTSLGCRVHYIMIDGQWSTLNDDRGFFSTKSAGIVVTGAKNFFGSKFASMISQNSDFSYSLYSGTGSCEGHGCVGPYITKIKANKNWLESSEKAATVAKFEIYAQPEVDCSKVFTSEVAKLKTCNPTNKMKTLEMKTECANV